MQQLKPIADQLWSYDFWQRLGPGVWFPGRMTVAQLSDGSLWLHSPSPIDDVLAAELAELGPVRALVEPNLFHHLHARAARERYPDAPLYAVPGFEKKQPDVPFEDLDQAAAQWANDLSVLHVRGTPLLEERVFLHRSSATLIVTDLVFHMRQTRGWITPLLLRLVGAHNRFTQSRSVKAMVRDRAALAQSYAQLLSWDFGRIVMAHGDVLHANAKPQLRAALQRTVELQLAADVG